MKYTVSDWEKRLGYLSDREIFLARKYLPLAGFIPASENNKLIQKPVPGTCLFSQRLRKTLFNVLISYDHVKEQVCPFVSVATIKMLVDTQQNASLSVFT